MSTSPRWTHSFSLNQEEEEKLQKILEKARSEAIGRPAVGIIDIVRQGLKTYENGK